MNPAEEKVLSDVQDYGWHVVKVLEEGDSPEFAYSIGLFRSFQHPEIFIYGLPSERAHLIINEAGEHIRSGRRFFAGQTSDELLEGYSVMFRAIPPSQYREHLGWASWFYDYADFPALQLVYPDRDGRWPWQSGTSEGFRRVQLVLADVPSDPLEGGGAA